MSKCPQCHNELVPDQNNPGKLLCYNCKKRFDAAQVEQLEHDSSHSQSSMHKYQQQAEPAQANPQQAYDMHRMQAQPGEQQYAAVSQAAPQPVVGGYAVPQQLPKGMAIASLVLAILGILGAWVPLANIGAIVFAIIALVFGIVGRGKAKRGEAGGKGIATAGIIIAVITIIASLAINIATYAFIDTTAKETSGMSFLEMIEEEGMYSTNLIDKTDTADNESSKIDKNAVNNNNSFWNDGKVKVNGKEVIVGKMTISEAATALGLEVSSDSDVKLDDVLGENNHYADVLLSGNGIPNTAQISLAFDYDEPDGKKIGDCRVTEFWYSDYADNPKDIIEMPGGLKNSITPDDVIAKLGEPQSNSSYGSAKSLSYYTNYPDDYVSTTYHFYDNNLESFSMSCE